MRRNLEFVVDAGAVGFVAGEKGGGGYVGGVFGVDGHVGHCGKDGGEHHVPVFGGVGVDTHFDAL